MNNNKNKDVQKSFNSNWKKKTAQARDPSIPKDWPSGPAGKKLPKDPPLKNGWPFVPSGHKV